MSKRRTEVDSASCLSYYTDASSNVSRVQADRIDISMHRPAKRGKISGLNARFDRMIKSVNSLLSYGNHNSVSSQKRMKSESSGTSSVSGHDSPKTPVNAYSNPHPVNIGKDFSLLKMSPLCPQGESDGCPKPVAPSKGPRSPLPDWLANTFSGLEPGHPLRGLVSPSPVNTEPTSPLKLPGYSHEEELFAFSPFQLDKQEEVLEAPSRADDKTSIGRGNGLSIVPKEPMLSHLQLRATSNCLPFSTPGHLPPAHRLTANLIVDGTSREPLVLPQQIASRATDTMHPSASPACVLRSDDQIVQPQLARIFSNLSQDNGGVPSDFQGHDTFTSHNCQLSQGGEDMLNVYATPGPTLACSRPVYFDSPTEDPSLSDPLQPKSYELDLNAIDFRWHPFLRSNAQECDTKSNFAPPSPPLGYTAPKRAYDQSGWYARFPVDQGDYGASSEEFPCLTEDVEIANLGDAGAIRPSNVNTRATDSSAIDNPIGPWAVDDVQQMPSASLAPADFLSPRRDLLDKSALLAADGIPPRVDGKNLHMTEESLLSREELTTIDASEVHEIQQPSTPIRQVPVYPPSTPHKARSGQRYEMSKAPVRKTSSALSWMMPLKFSKCTMVTQDGVSSRFSRVPPDSRDSIESWSETG